MRVGVSSPAALPTLRCRSALRVGGVLVLVIAGFLAGGETGVLPVAAAREQRAKACSCCFAVPVLLPTKGRREDSRCGSFCTTHPQPARRLAPSSTSPSRRSASTAGVLSPAQVAEFERTGAVVVPQLVSGELLARARQEQTALANHLPGKEYDAVAFAAWRQRPVFEELALRSNMAKAAAQLVGRSDLHVLLDAFFVLSGDLPGCGWHVDDAFFWPVARADDAGVNVWVALDEVDDAGGGLAVAPGTHLAAFDDARRVIRDPGPDGKAQTCRMADLDPEQNARIERLARIPNMRPGDAIIHKRFIFHRSQPFDPTSPRHGRAIGRYSCRYVPPDVVLDGVTLVDAPATTDPDSFSSGKGGRPSSPIAVVPLPNVRIDEAHRAHFPEKYPRIQLGGAGGGESASSS